MLALYYAAWVHRQRGEHGATVEKVEAAMDTGRAHALRTERTAVLARLASDGALEETQLAQIHELARMPWWPWIQTFYFCLLAEAYARAGRPANGLAVLAEIPGQALEHVYASEAHRCRGELFLAQEDAAGAESCFRVAVDLSHDGGQRSLEVRAATSLSRLLVRQGNREEARQVLGSVYGWFTEGFDTADLKAAKQVLDSLERRQ
jgi:hypothetical protein